MNGIQPSSCNRARQWVSLALDRELSEFERFLMEDHLKGCADCAVFERDTRLMTEGIRATPLERLSAPIGVGRIRHQRRFGRLQLANVVPAAVAVASVFVAITFVPEQADVIRSQQPLESAVAEAATVNELVLEVRRRNLRQQSQPEPRRPVGDIGPVTASLSGSTN